MRDARSSAATVSAALGGELTAVRALVGALSPVVQTRVARGLLRSGARSRLGSDLRQEVEDFTQEVFAALFADGGRVLREWDPERGLSLPNYVGFGARAVSGGRVGGFPGAGEMRGTPLGRAEW